MTDKQGCVIDGDEDIIANCVLDSDYDGSPEDCSVAVSKKHKCRDQCEYWKTFTDYGEIDVLGLQHELAICINALQGIYNCTSEVETQAFAARALKAVLK